MSKDGDIRNEGKITTGRKGENTNKFKENYQKIDWTVHKREPKAPSSSKPSPACNGKS